MNRKINREQLVSLINGFDVRAKKFTEEQYNEVIDFAFAEMSTIARLFSNEEVVSTKEFYDNNELIYTLDIQEDVVYVYDLYLTKENQDFNTYKHGIRKIRDENVVYKDNREVGRIHVDLTKHNEQLVFDNVVIKYFYTPQSTSEDIYLDQPTYLALKYALGMSLYELLNDVDRSMKKFSAMKRAALSAIPNDPEDLLIGKISIFPDGV